MDDSPTRPLRDGRLSESALPPAQAIRMGELLTSLAGALQTVGEDAVTAEAGRSSFHNIVGALLELAGSLILVAGHLREQVPDNWPSWLYYASLGELIQDGFPVTWVPNSEVLAAMIEAPDRPSRQRVLLDMQDQVLPHAAGVLSRVTAEDLTSDRAVVEQALRCVTHSPGLAQIGALITAVNRGQAEVGAASLGELFRHGEEAAKGEPLRNAERLQRTLMLTALAPTLTHFRPARLDPVPTRPHRHAVAHLTSDEQLTSANALESVLLAVSVLRQAQADRDAGASPQGDDEITSLSEAQPAGEIVTTHRSRTTTKRDTPGED